MPKSPFARQHRAWGNEQGNAAEYNMDQENDAEDAAHYCDLLCINPT
jgi:hypothetical protein